MKYPAIFTALYLVLLSSCATSQQESLINTKEIMKNKESISAFYNNALTVNETTRPTAVLTSLMAPGYKSTGSVDVKNAEQLMQQLEFFWKVVPDLKWEPQMIANDEDRYIVRSVASGTPNGDFMGTPTDGTVPFKIMTIDIHEMKDGKFISTHHVEDWVTSMKQLKGGAKKKGNAMTIADAFMGAMGKGDMETMSNLMHDDMVWQNAGDKSLPWIGPWVGKKIILEKFLPSFGENFQTLKWEPVDALTTDDTAAYFGQMVGLLTKSNQKTDEFTYALRVKVKDGKVILWNWFEDSVEVANAYHGKK